MRKWRPDNPVDFFLYLLLGSLFVVLVSIRLSLLQLPLDRDEGEYAYAGWRILNGEVPFRDFYNMKMPGIYGAYSILFLLLGTTATAVRMGAILVNICNAIFVFYLGRRWGGSRMGIYSTICFLVFSLQVEMQGLNTHAEQFAVLFALPGLLLMYKAYDRSSGKYFLMSGFFAGLAFLMKQPAFIFVVLTGLLAIMEGLSRKLGIKVSIVNVLLIAAGSALPLLLTVIGLGSAGAGTNFRFFAFDYAREYISSTDWLWGYHNFRFVVKNAFESNRFLWLIVPAFVILLPFRRIKTLKWHVLIFFLFSFIAVCPGLYFRPHYFQFVIPAVSVLAGSVLFSAENLFEKRVNSFKWLRWLPACILIVSIAAFFLNDNNIFSLRTKDAFHNQIFGHDFRVATRKAGEFISEKSSPGSRVAILGAEPEICFYAKRKAASGYMYVYPLLENHRYAPRMLRQFIDEIQDSKPDIFVYMSDASTWYANESVHQDILKWYHAYTARHYKRIGLVDMVDNSLILYYWNEDATVTPVNNENFIEIYQRK